MKRNFRRGLAAVCALAMLAPSVAFPAETRVNAAYQLLGETTFDHKILPWMPVESSPAKQQFEITKDGELHIRILSAVGADREKWDLEIRHRNLSFQAGHTYELEVKVSEIDAQGRINLIRNDIEYAAGSDAPRRDGNRRPPRRSSNHD